MQPHPPASELECVKWRLIVFTCENGYQLLCVDFVNKDENQVLDDERVPRRKLLQALLIMMSYQLSDRSIICLKDAKGQSTRVQRTARAK
jgi:hypothetical protein